MINQCYFPLQDHIAVWAAAPGTIWLRFSVAVDPLKVPSMMQPIRDICTLLGVITASMDGTGSFGSRNIATAA